MTNRLWLPALAALALLLSACGDSQEESSVTLDEPSSVSDDEVVQEEDAPAAAENAAEMPSPDEVEDDIESRQAAEELERAEALRSDTQEDPVSADESLQEVEANEDTLAADPDDVLEEGGAMPGEATRSDVDQMIEETEQRFEEAQRRLNEQFEEVEQQAVEPDAFDEDTFSTDWEVESSLPENPRLEDNLEATDVDALIEDTERRFEEAQKRLEEQFKEIEREHDDSRSRGAILSEDADADADADATETETTNQTN
ncbi:hypothetical protein ACT3R7_01035 [Halomonas sp. AOP43-A1-21]